MSKAKYRSGKISRDKISKWQIIECKISKWQNIESKISKWQNIESLADLLLSEQELRGKTIVFLVTRRRDWYINALMGYFYNAPHWGGGAIHRLLLTPKLPF